jgi:hypothetical protein
MASSEDGFVEAKNFQADAENHWKKAISYYEKFIGEVPASNEAVLSREKLKRLRMRVDTNARKFYYICH